MRECNLCKGKGFIWVMLKGEVEKDLCVACEARGYFDEDDDGGEDDNSEEFDFQEPNPEDR